MHLLAPARCLTYYDGLQGDDVYGHFSVIIGNMSFGGTYGSLCDILPQGATITVTLNYLGEVAKYGHPALLLGILINRSG